MFSAPFSLPEPACVEAPPNSREGLVASPSKISRGDLAVLGNVRLVHVGDRVQDQADDLLLYPGTQGVEVEAQVRGLGLEVSCSTLARLRRVGI